MKIIEQHAQQGLHIYGTGVSEKNAEKRLDVKNRNTGGLGIEMNYDRM